MFEVLLDALIDSLKIFPILFLVYLLIEYLLHKKQQNFYDFVSKSKKYSPIWASLLGAVPQCGFGAVMADGFSKKGITLGALIAVFISTSDEAFPLLIAHPELYGKLALLIAIKVVYAIIIGFAVNFVVELINKKKLETVNVEEGHVHHDHCCADNIFLNAFKHSLNIFIYLLIATAIINVAIYFIGVENISAFLNTQGFLQILVAPVVGLIPNCAASVLLVELFIENALTFSALVAGLSAGAGVGLLVLLKNNKNQKQNLLIIAMLYTFSIILGTILYFCGL